VYSRHMAKLPDIEAVPVARPAMDEVALLAAVGRGESAAFSALVNAHLPAVLGTARRMLRDAAEAEDVAQEAMLRLWRNAATLELGPGGLRPWLRRVVSNLSIDRIRASRKTSVVAEVPEQPVAASQSSGLESADLARRVQSALADLPERQRQALMLFHFEGLSQIEVGHSLGVSDEAVESLLARARRALKVVLKHDWQHLLPDTID
jgi:RNA polymerase sigma-70 factor, ECF subfamily